jgi:hypothetical protein
LSATETKWYRPGLQFHSPFSGYEVICRPFFRQLTATGETLTETRELKAEFATHGAEMVHTDSDGVQTMHPDIRGHYFNLDAQAEQKGWTDDEKETVARKLLMEIVVKYPGECRLHSAAPAGRPWPKYDTAHHNQIPVLAEQFGCVAEALAYEKENKNRESVVAKLNELLATPAEEDAVEDDLIAA